MLEERSLTIPLGREAFVLGVSDYLFRPQLTAQNPCIIDLLVRLMNSQRRWGFGICYLNLRD